MRRLFICGTLQVVFVTAYGMLLLLRPNAAFPMMPLFVGGVWVLVLYNNWAVWRLWRR